MVRLDGDDGLFATNGKRAERDVVQFVPFREVGLSPDRLAQELLAELPKQVTDYMVCYCLYLENDWKDAWTLT